MRIHLPNSAFLGNIDPFLKSFDNSDPSILEITTNSKWISIHPVVLSIVAAIGLTMDKDGIIGHDLEAKSTHYLERMGLFKILNIPSSIEIIEHKPAGRFIPLTQIKNSTNLSTFIKEIIPLLHLAPRQAETIKYIVSELVRNVLEHSQSEMGAIVCAQYYKKSNTIRIGIVDRGIGIKRSISKAHFVKSDLDAIKLALIPGITGTTRREGGTELNAGAGLFFIKSMSSINRDFFIIYSGNAMYKLLKSKLNRKKVYGDPFQDRHSKAEKYPFWQGTVIGIDISLDTTEGFTSHLDLIRETYIKTVKERKKERFRRPRFI